MTYSNHEEAQKLVPRLLTGMEVANILRLPYAEVIRKKNNIPGRLTWGGRTKWNPEVLSKWINEHTQPIDGEMQETGLPPRLLTAQEAAEILRIPYVEVVRRKNQVPGRVILGRRTRFNPIVLNRWIAAHTEPVPVDWQAPQEMPY